MTSPDTLLKSANSCGKPHRHAVLERYLSRLGSANPEFRVYPTNHPDRASIETYIAAAYQRSYGARLHTYLPTLYALGCNGETAAAAGVRRADNLPLFLESYLERPIESYLEELDADSPKREAVAEIGNLVATHRGASQLLFLLLANRLHREGVRWIACTATPAVIASLSRLPFEYRIIANADGTRLGAEASRWGSYYDSQPRVLIGSLGDALQRVRQRPVAEAALQRYGMEVWTREPAPADDLVALAS